MSIIKAIRQLTTIFKHYHIASYQSPKHDLLIIDDIYVHFEKLINASALQTCTLKMQIKQQDTVCACMYVF